MRLRVLAVGKLKPAGLVDFEASFQKRMRATMPLEVLALKDTATMLARAERPRVVLDERGREPTSRELADWLDDWRARGVRCVDFLIGDAHGFDDVQRADADRVMALSRLTLPHRLARVMIVEQLYRASTILSGHPYHHE